MIDDVKKTTEVQHPLFEWNSFIDFLKFYHRLSDNNANNESSTNAFKWQGKMAENDKKLRKKLKPRW